MLEKVNLSAVEIALVPAAFVTVTSTVPAAPAGVTAVINVSDWTVKLAAAVEPNLTVEVTLQYPRPVIDTVVPPAMEPELGLTPVTLGGPPVNP
jgi:hypothetical protein